MNRRAIRGAKLQRGVALIAMLAVFVMGGTYFLLRALNSQASVTAAKHTRNAEVLNRAKQALIGYVARQATMPGENNPGRLPCPEGSPFVGGTNEGIAAPTVGAPTCASIGRLPWRTLGIDNLLDTASEPLWYVVGPAWRLTTSASTLLINSDTPAPATAGQITVDGQRTVALIIAPGAAMNVQASGLCAARLQARNAPSPTIDSRDYLECFDATTLTFTTTDPSTSLNDQVLRVTVEDVMPAIEAAISNRIEREIVPVLRAVYEAPSWGLTGSRRMFPYAVLWPIPPEHPGNSTFVGTAGTYQGLLPFNQTQGCTFGAGNERCQPALNPFSGTPGPVVETLGWGSIDSQSCSWVTVNQVRRCTGEYKEAPSPDSWRPIYLQMSATFADVAMGLRALDTSKVTIEVRDNSGSPPWISLTPIVTATMNSTGTATITFGATVPNIDAMGWSTRAEFRFVIDRSVMADHALLNSSDPVTGWFVRNEWFRLLYYAAAQTTAATSLPNVGCTTDSNCLRLTTWPSTAVEWDKRALLIVAGRSLANAARPNSTVTDFVEFGNNDGGTLYEQQPISTVLNAALKAPFNDRVLVLDKN